MNRRDFLKRCGAIVAGGFVLSNRAMEARLGSERPNIVFIFIDDMGWTDAGFMGSRYYETPNIDKLASQGMVFTNAYANAANCAPTRACLLTGQYSPRHGVYTVGSSARGASKDRRLIPIANDTTLDASHITIAEALKSAGYTSACMGKWHMGDDPELGPIGQGFDVNIAGGSRGSPYAGTYFSPYHNPYLPDGPKGEYLTDRLADEALSFIEANRSKPFFLYLTHYAVHTPLQAKADLIAKYKNKPPSNGHRNPTYAAMIDSVDQGVGRIMDKLDELKLADNTVIFFFSDNGGFGGATSNQPLRGFKGMFYEGGIREPMIVRWPSKVRPGTTCDVPVISIDFFPTILEMAGIKTEYRSQKSEVRLSVLCPLSSVRLDGESIVPLLEGENSLKRQAIFWHFPAYLQGNLPGSRDNKFRTRPVGVVRKDRWKLLQYFEEWVLDGGWDTIETNKAIELYDLENDIGETTNLANVNTAKRDELLNLLINWQNSIGAPVPTERNPVFVRRSRRTKTATA